MNILLLGSGGREHAIAWKLAQSKKLSTLYISPGNAGTEELGKNVLLNNFDEIASFIQANSINMLVVGPEAPLVEGIQNFLSKKFPQLKIIGPSMEGARLEGSKEYAKAFMQRNKIPTASYQSFTSETIGEGYEFLNTLKPPYVLKADGLAGGKGVLILENLEEAKAELQRMLEGKFGEASSNVVIEEYLDGIEMSVFVLTDGKGYKILPEAKDYKRIGEGDTGLNTGGMGAVSPVPFVSDELMGKIEKRIVRPSIEGLNKEKINYRGFLFIGLMIVDNAPFVIEYNVRMGDPETEVVMPRIKSDLIPHLVACAEGTLKDEVVEYTAAAAATVMLVAEGYPESYPKGMLMRGLNDLSNCIPFHAGTKKEVNQTFSNGGRILAITALGDTIESALVKAYENVEKVSFENKYYRKDIGADLLKQ